MEPKRISCKSCGAPLKFSEENKGVATCDYCGSVWTLPKHVVDPAALDMLRQGELALDNCKFAEAATAYRKAAEIDSEEPEAFFGMALAKYRVQYLKDEAADKPRMQPICHEISSDVFSQDENFKRALTLATAQQRAEYLKKGWEIDNIRTEFYKLKQSELDYDCFICVKVSGEGGRRTTDCDLANDIYYYLRDHGYKPFFSERDIKGRMGSDYEALILYALYMSECMIIVCSREEYLETKWVKNEYTRFVRMIADEEKENDAITFAFSGRPVERLPGRSGKIQGVNLNERDAFPLLAQFVKHHTVEARAEREQAEKRNKQQQERLFQEFEEQKRAQERMEERLKNMAYGAQSGTGPTVHSLLVRAKQELVRKNFSESQKYCKEVLNMDPENGEAWVRMYLAESWEKMTRQFGIDVKPDGDSVAPAVELRTYGKGQSLMEYLEDSLECQSFLNAEAYGKSSLEFQTMIEKSCEVLKDVRPALVKEQEKIRANGKKANGGQDDLRDAYRELLEKHKAAQRKRNEANERREQIERSVQQKKQKRKKLIKWGWLIGFAIGFVLGILLDVFDFHDVGSFFAIAIAYAVAGAFISEIIIVVSIAFSDWYQRYRGSGSTSSDLHRAQNSEAQAGREVVDIAKELKKMEQALNSKISAALGKWDRELKASITYLDALDRVVEKLQSYRVKR